MRERNYGQYCGLAYALDLIGERWALLVVRDLLLGPKRLTDISRGLPGIPSNVLSARLKQLDGDGIVARRILPRPDGSIVYELTSYGRELEGILLQLGLWGARSLGVPRPGESLTPIALMLALRASFQPAAAKSVKATFELRLGDVVVHARVDRGAIEVGEGHLPDAQLVLESDPTLVEVLTGQVPMQQAIDRGGITASGDEALLESFTALFRLPPPVTEAELAHASPAA